MREGFAMPVMAKYDVVGNVCFAMNDEGIAPHHITARFQECSPDSGWMRCVETKGYDQVKPLYRSHPTAGVSIMKRLVSTDLVESLALAPDPEQAGEWPAERLATLIDWAGFRWGLPISYGGIEATSAEMMLAYMDLARECLTTAFILTQRNAATQRIAACDNDELKERCLADHVHGRRMATVGISHLSTSRQHWSRPSVSATEKFDGYELRGEAPWVTGGARADLILTGAALDDGRQILVAIPIDRAGVEVCTPLRMLALNETETGTIRFHHVSVSSEDMVAGPVDNVMKEASAGPTSGTGSVTTSALALGMAERILNRLREEATRRQQLEYIADGFTSEHTRLKNDLLNTADSEDKGTYDLRHPADEIRLRANSLIARIAHALMIESKGSGFVTGHPAERAVREAMFFQVWSCPRSVASAALDELIC
jgi:alkylation response protein AidB-like acyl-CoA dehydrogenase